MAITAAQVKELREKSGAGVMDAKKALVETDGDMEKAMKKMGINPNNLPKNMPNGMDMSSLEGMMGGNGMPDLSALGGGDMDLSQMMGGGLKGKVGEFAMKQSVKRMANKMKKAKKKRRK